MSLVGYIFSETRGKKQNDTLKDLELRTRSKNHPSSLAGALRPLSSLLPSGVHLILLLSPGLSLPWVAAALGLIVPHQDLSAPSDLTVLAAWFPDSKFSELDLWLESCFGDTWVTGQSMDGLLRVRFLPLGQPGAGSRGPAAYSMGAEDRGLWMGNDGQPVDLFLAPDN